MLTSQRPFEASNHEALATKIRAADPAFPHTNPPVSNPCLHAVSSLLERDKTQRIGAASFESFSDNPFFRAISFPALERKELDPVFRPSSDKTNFDATYDLEELLLEEAPLEARARRQKPREQLKVDATKAEIRADELHRMIEKLFEPFDYTLAQFERSRTSESAGEGTQASPATTGTGGVSAATATASSSVRSAGSPVPGEIDLTGNQGGYGHHHHHHRAYSGPTPNGSPPMPSADDRLPPTLPIQGARIGDFAREQKQQHQPLQPPRSVPDDMRQARAMELMLLQDDGGGGRRRRMRSQKRSTRKGASSGDGSGTDLEVPIPTFPPALRASGDPGSLGLAMQPPGGFKQGEAQQQQQQQQQRPSGMLAFLSRNKRGRDRSPGAGSFGGREKERGVLGKAGARSVVGN
jgi:serine/threonine kinase 32